MNAAPEPADAPRKRYRLKPSGCCDMPRVVHLTDAEAAPGLASGVLQALPPLPAPAAPAASPVEPTKESAP